MKKICIIALFAAACSLTSANAVTITAPLSTIHGEDAYTWGVPITLASGQTITSASLSFNNITLTAANQSGKGILYSDLLKSSATGVHTSVDNDAIGDYFAGVYTSGNIASLGSKVFNSVGTTLSWVVNFNSTQLAAMNAFLAGGIFDIGFDPDCTYTIGSICLTYTTSTSVPDTATTVYVLGLALLALEMSRRKLAVVKK